MSMTRDRARKARFGSISSLAERESLLRVCTRDINTSLCGTCARDIRKSMCSKIAAEAIA